MRQNAKKFGPTLWTLVLALFLVGTLVLAPCLVSAQDSGAGQLIQDTRGIRCEGSCGGASVAPGFGSPAGGNILFEQPPYGPSDSWQAYTSDKNIVPGGYLCLEDFWGLTNDIGDIHWYGLSLLYSAGWHDCDPTGMEFQIIFYQDSGGSPGTPVATFSNVIPTITYYDTYGGYPAYRFEVDDLGTPVSLAQGWVSIQSTSSPNGCSFLWLNSPTGNTNAIQQGIGNLTDNLAFALTKACTPPPNVNKYLHSEGGYDLGVLSDPIGTQWQEIYPLLGREYHLSSWNDTGGDVLSPSDQIDMYEKPDGELRDYHVENVTTTLFVTQNKTGESMYIELVGGFNALALMFPIGTQWQEIYPDFCREYQLSAWNDTGNTPSELGYCDYVLLEPKGCYGPFGPLYCPLDEDFSSWLPSGWATDDWFQLSTNNAGGTSPEALLYYYNITGDYAYLDSKPVYTTGAPYLTLEFKSFIDDFCSAGVYNCTVYTRADGGDGWTDVTPWSNPIYGNVDPDSYSIDISSDIGPATQVRFEFDSEPGSSYCINDWYVDDVRICYPGTWWHVEDYAIDIIVTPEPPPVGGEAYPVNKIYLLAPWIAVAAVLAGGISWYVLRRRRTQS